MHLPNVPLDSDLSLLRDSLVNYHTERLWAEQDRRARRRSRQGAGGFSLKRSIENMGYGALDGGDRELLEKCAKIAGVPFDPNRVFLPWALLKRDLTVAGAASAGYLVGTSVGAAADILRGWSFSFSAGATFMGGLQDNLLIPRVTTAPTTHAIPTESTAITESTPLLGQVALVPKNLACFIEFSRRFLLQADAEQFVRMVMLSALGQFLDQQILSGTGVSGELLGLFNVAGVQTQSGTSLGHSGVTTMKKLSSEAGARDENLAFVSTPAIRQTLEIREKATGNGGFVWQAGTVADRPAFASNDCPTASMIVGPWPQVVVGQWGPPGITLEINPYEQTNFRAGILQARMVLSVDMAVIRPSAFVKSTSIT
jgi:HK97 family phage major capsid protein